MKLEGETATARFALAAGERRRFILTPRPLTDLETGQADEWCRRTNHFWKDWSRFTSYHGPHRDAVVRSSIVLKAMTYAPSGALVAAPTTSLPETIGGVRNWDYRYCWLRDACFALYALQKLGHLAEGLRFFEYLVRISEETLPKLLPLYSIEGETELGERTVEDYEGYRGSAPVRVGNLAVDQVQLDVYGQLLDLMYFVVRVGGELDERVTRIATALADHIAGNWQEPDAGLWEPRLEPRRHVHSAIMSWVALDRAIRLFGERPQWVQARDALLADLRHNGIADGGYLTQHFGAQDVDAAVLVAPMVDLPLDESVLSRTVDEIIARLGAGPLVYRYLNEDGLPGKEGTFLVCAFWLVDALAALGRGEEARQRFAELVALSNDLGLYPEQMGEDGTFLGNFPQAFTHLGLLQSALILDLLEHGGVEAVRGTYADRALRDTANRGLEPMSGGFGRSSG